MEFKELQEKILERAKRYAEIYNVEFDETFVLLKLHEEVGELTQAYLVHAKKSRPEKHVSEEASKEAMAKELADIIGMAIINAAMFDIDLEEAIRKKWIDRE